MKIRFRLILFLLFLTLIFLILFIFYGIYEQKRITSLSNAVQLEKEFVFDRILEIQGKSLKTFSYDYSYWDDMVKFVTSPDKKWAAEHIDVSLDTYAANAAWVYNLDWQLVYSVNNLKQDDLLKELPIPKDAFGSLFKHLPSCHFFVNTPAGLMEFWGATIQSSVDLQRKELAKGYFFTSRLWGQSYINELSRITDSSVILSDTENIPIRLKKDAIEFSRIIIGGDNHPVEYITVTSTSQAVER